MNAQPVRSYLGISEVLAQLRAEFPDISVSKIRFLETEGLIEPARSPSGYRRFAPADVERLRYILTAQRDQYLPLRVIKERLIRAAGGAGSSGQPGPPAQSAAPARSGNPARSAPPARAAAPAHSAAAAHSAAPAHSGAPAHSAAPAHHTPGRAPAGPLTRRELIEAAGITEPQLTDLESFGLLRRSGRVYSPDAVDVARTVAALTAYGVEARHLRAVRAAAERETTLIEQVVAPILRQRSAGARELAGQTAREIAVLALQLHRALIESALAEAGFAGTGLPDGGISPAERSPAAAEQGGRDRRGAEGATA